MLDVSIYRISDAGKHTAFPLLGLSLTLEWGHALLEEVRMYRLPFTAISKGVYDEFRSKGKEKRVGEERTGTTVILHFSNTAPLVEYLFMSLK